MTLRIPPLRPTVAAALAASALLAGCGVGLSLGFGSDGYDDLPPVVSVATVQTAVAAGSSVRFVAAAADEDGIEYVAFYRIDGDVGVLIATDRSEPWQASIVAPADGRGLLSVFARAVDRSGRENDSKVVSLPVVQ